MPVCFRIECNPFTRLLPHFFLGMDAAACRAAPMNRLDLIRRCSADLDRFELEFDIVKDDVVPFLTVGTLGAPSFLRAIIEQLFYPAASTISRRGNRDPLRIEERRRSGSRQFPRVTFCAGGQCPPVNLVTEHNRAGVDARADAVCEPTIVSIPPGNVFCRMVLPESRPLTSDTFALSR